MAGILLHSIVHSIYNVKCRMLIICKLCGWPYAEQQLLGIMKHHARLQLSCEVKGVFPEKPIIVICKRIYFLNIQTGRL